MNTMQTAVLIGHTVIALLIIILVLLQRGKGADAGAAFGAGASGTVFGARGSSNFFSRATAVLATVFFVSSLALAYMSSQRPGAPESLLDGAAPLEETQEVVDPMDALPELDAPLDETDGGVEEDMPALEVPADESAEPLPESSGDDGDTPQA